MLKYSVNVVWSDEDEAFLATIPEFPGLSAFGESQKEAIEEALIAAEGMVEVCKYDNEPIPEPHKKKEYSGQTRLRLPKSLHEDLVREAEADNVSLNTYINHIITKNHTLEKVEKAQKAHRMEMKKIVMQDNAAAVESRDYDQQSETNFKYSVMSDDIIYASGPH